MLVKIFWDSIYLKRGGILACSNAIMERINQYRRAAKKLKEHVFDSFTYSFTNINNRSIVHRDLETPGYLLAARSPRPRRKMIVNWNESIVSRKAEEKRVKVVWLVISIHLISHKLS